MVLVFKYLVLVGKKIFKLNKELNNYNLRFTISSNIKPETLILIGGVSSEKNVYANSIRFFVSKTSGTKATVYCVTNSNLISNFLKLCTVSLDKEYVINLTKVTSNSYTIIITDYVEFVHRSNTLTPNEILFNYYVKPAKDSNILIKHILYEG